MQFCDVNNCLIEFNVWCVGMRYAINLEECMDDFSNFVNDLMGASYN